MTNNFNALVRERCSCRAYKPDLAPSDESLELILEAARLAPSACNRQPWRFMLIRPDDEKGQAAIRRAYDREWIDSAHTFIIVCGVPAEAWVRPYDNVSHLAIDVAIATEHMCLQATALGLGTCWVCHFDPAKLKAELNFPEGVEPMVILPVGFPANDIIPEKKRRKLDELVIPV
ncbi:MAG: nitroreductase family protein [Muribaculaceae bacterium]|nr:nitroreductase family protein [Muribaculaceae bacterium]